MNDYLMPIVWGAVMVLAVLAGRCIAIRRNRPDEWWLKRSKCPHCHTRKLLPTPMSKSSAVITCGDCEGQWFIVGADGQQIITGLGHRCYVPPLTFYWDHRGHAVFETKFGKAIFNIGGLGLETANAIIACRSPREVLKALAEHRIAPFDIEVSHEGTLDEQVQTFFNSAGIDLPFTDESKDH